MRLPIAGPALWCTPWIATQCGQIDNEIITIAVGTTAGAAAAVVEWTSWAKNVAEPRKVATQSTLELKDTCAVLAWVMGVSTHSFPKRDGQRQPTMLCRPKA
jgi:hypothetical protein